MCNYYALTADIYGYQVELLSVKFYFQPNSLFLALQGKKNTNKEYKLGIGIGRANQERELACGV